MVKTPAATCSGPSLTTSGDIGPATVLQPAVTPAARKPAAAVTLTAPPRTRSVQSFGEPEHQVHALHRLAGGTLAEVGAFDAGLWQALGDAPGYANA